MLLARKKFTREPKFKTNFARISYTYRTELKAVLLKSSRNDKNFGYKSVHESSKNVLFLKAKKMKNVTKIHQVVLFAKKYIYIRDHLNLAIPAVVIF